MPPESTPAEPLQFDNAEYSAESSAVLTCAACSRPVSGTYYQANGKTVCDSCRSAIEAGLRGGNGLVRFLRACLFGGLAAVAGFVLYFGVLKITGMEIGLISIVVGFMVGAAVRAGSRHRGGLAYQGLAVFLTYCAIATSYSALFLILLFSPEVQEMRAEAKRNNAKVGATAKPAAAEGKRDVAPAVAQGKTDVARPVAERKGDVAPAVAQGEEDVASDDEAGERDLKGKASIDPVEVLSFLFLLPIRANLQSPIGLLIVGFALWQAWKLNARAKLEFSGPYVATGEVKADGAAPETGLPGHA